MNKKYLLFLALALPLSASAVEMTWSGFGTLGYALSDQSYMYQRFINNQGTFKGDSILGAQLDLKLNPKWGATLQAKLAPATDSDSQWVPTLSWAFVSWRPLDDWLVRVGKFRLPLMLNTENADVGATYDLARLPIEVYSIAPTTDVIGVSVSKTWLTTRFDWTLEAYTGKAETHTRYYGREMRDPEPSPGSWFLPFDMKSTGLVLTTKDIDNTFRIGIHQAEASRGDPKIHADVPYRVIAPGVGIYDLSTSARVDKLTIPVQTLGASVMLPAGVRVTAEYARIKVESASKGLTRWGAYLALSRRFGEWTPYVYYAKVKSPNATLEQYKAINGNTVPLGFPRASQINATQKVTADVLSPYDQSTIALGSSYRLTANGLIKAEWSSTRTGVVSSFVDAPSGGNSADQRINVFSISYNFTF